MPTTALSLIVLVPVAGSVTPFEINVTFPPGEVILAVRFVKVLVLMFCESVAAEFEI